VTAKQSLLENVAFAVAFAEVAEALAAQVAVTRLLLTPLCALEPAGPAVDGPPDVGLVFLGTPWHDVSAARFCTGFFEVGSFLMTERGRPLFFGAVVGAGI
jgi:hypothetical protein